MTTRRISRRTVLRGMLLGSAVSVALPPLEIFRRGGGVAHAAESSFPQRFCLFFWGNGMLPDRWIPATTGEDWEMSDQLAPLAALREDIAVITGTEVKIQNLHAHGSGPAGFLSGAPLSSKDGTLFAAKSFDQLMADELGGDTLYPSIHTAVQPNAHGLSFYEPGQRHTPYSDPAALFSSYFGAEFVAPGEDPAPNPALGIRRSVLDVVMEDSARLTARLGSADRARLDQHLTAVRELEKRIEKFQSDPPNYEACERPVEPGELPDIDGRPQMSERSAVVSELMAMAFACDLTRIGTITYSDELNDLLFPNATMGHHQLTHDEPPPQPEVHDIVVQGMADLAVFLEALRAIPEGDGTLLSNTIVLATSDVSFGRTHQIDEFPIVVAGQGGGTIRTGFHYRSEAKENAGKVPLSIMRAMGMQVSEFGVDEALATDGLSELEA